MAGHKSNSVPRAAPNRPRARNRPRAAASPERPQPLNRLPTRDPPPTTLDDAIEQERGRMNRACSVLACLSHALLYQEDFEGNPDRPSFSDLAELAHDLVADAVHRLDSLYVGHLPRRR
jgi:hypothetical protein